MTRRFLVIYESGPTNMGGFAPDVAGCASTAHSLEEMRTNLLEGLALDGQAIPQAITRTPKSLKAASPSGSLSSCPSPKQSPLDIGAPFIALLR